MLKKEERVHTTEMSSSQETRGTGHVRKWLPEMSGSPSAADIEHQEVPTSKDKKQRCPSVCKAVGLLLILILGVIIGCLAGFYILNGLMPKEPSHDGVLSALLSEQWGKDIQLPNDGQLRISMGMRNDYLIQDCQGGGMKKSFPDLDYVLMGYNVLKGYPMAAGHDPGFTQPIFKADYSKGRQTADCKFSIPDGYTIIPDVSCAVSFTSETITNSEDLKKSMGISAQVSGGGWGVSFSASASYQKDSKTVSTGKTVFIMSRATCQSYFSRIDDITPPPLHGSFLKWIHKLNNSKGYEDYIDFIAYYGTHYMKSVTFGARYLYQHSMTSRSYEQLKSRSISVEAQASYSGVVNVGGGVGFSDSQSEAVRNFNQKVETHTITVGSAPPANGDATAWASSAKETPVPYKYEMESIEKLFTPALMERYPDLDTGKLRRNLEYIRLRHSKTIYQKSLGKLCRVYNSAIPLAKTCLGGANDTIKVTDEMHCMQECLERQGCVGITVKKITNMTLCSFFTNDDEPIRANFDGTKDGEEDVCRSMLFPFTLQIQLDSYIPDEVPGMLSIIGMTFSTDEHWYGNEYGNGTFKCVERCLHENPGCVLAAYRQRGESFSCLFFKGEGVAKLKFVYVKTDSYLSDFYLTFIKTCQL